MFSSEWCVLEMMRMMQFMTHDWGWTTQLDGSLLFSHKKDHILVEPALPLSFEELMSAFETAAWEEAEAQSAQYEWVDMQMQVSQSKGLTAAVPPICLRDLLAPARVGQSQLRVCR